MIKAKVENKLIPVLVPFKDWQGVTVRYGWVDVPGVEIAFDGAVLRNGETLTFECGLSLPANGN